MQLKYSSQVRNKVVTMEFETTNFLNKENTALERFGEPIIVFEEVYGGTFPVSFNRRIKSGFKIRVKFDGTEDLEAATAAANQFSLDIQERLSEEMRILMDKLRDHELDFKPSSGLIDIKY